MWPSTAWYGMPAIGMRLPLPNPREVSVMPRTLADQSRRPHQTSRRNRQCRKKTMMSGYWRLIERYCAGSAYSLLSALLLMRECNARSSAPAYQQAALFVRVAVRSLLGELCLVEQIAHQQANRDLGVEVGRFLRHSTSRPAPRSGVSTGWSVSRTPRRRAAGADFLECDANVLGELDIPLNLLLLNRRMSCKTTQSKTVTSR